MMLYPPPAPWIIFRPGAGTVLLCLIVLAFALSGCATTRTDHLPDVEAQAKFTYSELIEVLSEIFDDPRVQYDKGLFESANVRRYTTYRPKDYVSVQRWIHPILPEWSEGWLCVQFAQAMRLGFSFAAGRDEWSNRADRSPPAIAWFVVSQVHDWGGVSGSNNSRHALNVYVAGPRGEMSVWVMEPQTGDRVRVAWQDEEGWIFDEAAYPNWPYIEQVRLEL